ncbi:MAG: tyrosine-type recombinase/integrase [Actinomycetota bacterium]|nr:tyrosine-type recombinase/integrase [Actinomycetota bacterium]
MQCSSLIDIRDRSVLSLGFVVASRRRNLSDFNVGDLELSTHGAVVTFRRSKTDQYGRDPRKADVKRLGGGPYDPVANVEAWLDAYTEALGRPLDPGDPLFCRIDRHGRLVRARIGRMGEDPAQGHALGGSAVRLQRPAFSEIVRLRAAQAGLSGRFRSHSLRRGMATSAARRGMPIYEIAKRGGWKSLDTVAGYIEEAQRFDTSIGEALGLGDD